ncbi:MAG TPA: hypothetical protein ENJ95_17990 [Bacteroidetes bacterium]|nr:hypothetical protein [Bacteroidota bacterium]
MKKIIVPLILFLFSFSLFGQIGINGAYKTFAADEWMELINGFTDINIDSPNGYYIGLDYWFRLKQKRIEFLPEIGYSSLSANSSSSNIEINLLAFHFNTNIYPLDFKGDCDCPTWSKGGKFFEKGFFIQLSPGIIKSNIDISSDTQLTDEKTSYFEIGMGAGIDIGISDFVTLTPIVKYYITPKTEYWPSEPATDFGPAKSNIKQLYAGLRVGFRFDEKKNRRRRRK